MFKLQLLKSILLEPLSLLTSLTPLSRFLHPRDHFAPHAGAPSEGYYTRILTTSGANVLLIFSSVFKAKDKPHYLHFSLLQPRGGLEHKDTIVVHRFPAIEDTLLERHENGRQEFRRDATGDGVNGFYMIGKKEQSYRFQIDDVEGEKLEVEVDLKKRTPWERDNMVSTPEGVFANLVFLLPLHWNVFSTASEAEVRIKRGGRTVMEEMGTAHVEKNWGVEFPKGWTWLQGFDKPTNESTENTAISSFALAGGKILGQKAYLLGYRSPNVSWSFRPPFTLLPFSCNTPFISETLDSKRGTMLLQVNSFTKKLEINVEAPPDHEGWLGMCCPLAQGHGNTFAYESFEGRIRVKAYERSWNLWSGAGEWRKVEERCFSGAAVEFGGSYSFKVIQNIKQKEA